VFNTPDEIGAVDVRTRGAKNGVCPLDASSLVPLANLPATLTGKDADTVDTYHAGNSSGQVAVSNGTVCTDLNADKLDTFHASQTPTASYLLAAGSDATMPIKPIWDKTVTGAAVTSVTTNGEVTLDGNTHGGYDFEFILINTSGSTTTYRLYYNNDTTNANYNYNIEGGAIAGADAIMSPGVVNNGQLHGRGSLTISPAGLVVSIWPHYRSNDNTWYQMFHQKTATVANLTRIDWVSSVASGIGINSRFRLWRRM
jgi:hypothetical protein